MRLKQNWIAFYTLLRRELIRMFRIWPQTLLPPVITMSLYYIIFGHIMGSRIGDMHGVSYIQYIVPGLVMLAVINNSYLHVVSSFYINKFQRNIEEMLVSPMPNYTILAGYLGGGIMRGLIIGILVIAMSLFFTKLEVYHMGLTLLIATLTATLFSLAGFVNGVFAKSFDALSIVPMFVLTPLTYLGGVFYASELLPKFWKSLTYFNPIFYIVNGFRYSMLGIADVEIEYTLALIFASVLVLYFWSLWLLNRGVGLRT